MYLRRFTHLQASTTLVAYSSLVFWIMSDSSVYLMILQALNITAADRKPVATEAREIQLTVFPRCLQAANFVGNPFAQESEYRPYVLAHLKYLKYLDYRMVDEQAVTAAKEQYQEDLLDMEEREAKDADDAKAAETAAKRLGEVCANAIDESDS